MDEKILKDCGCTSHKMPYAMYMTMQPTAITVTLVISCKDGQHRPSAPEPWQFHYCLDCGARLVRRPVTDSREQS